MPFNLDNYEEVKDRIPLFFEKYEDGRVYTEILSDTPERVVMRTFLYKNLDEQSQNCPLATGIAHEEPGGHIAKYYENAETSSIGRALANLNIKSDTTPRPSREEMASTESMMGNPNSSANRKPSSAPQTGNGGDHVLVSSAGIQRFEFYCKTHDFPYNHTQGQKDVGRPPAHKIQGEEGWCSEGSQ